MTLISAASLCLSFPGFAGTAAAARAELPCTRQCLYEVLDQYLQALKAHDAKSLPWSQGARYTENNVALAPGDGLWRTVSGIGDYALRFADVASGQVGYYGTARETDIDSPFALRLRVQARRITEAEIVLARVPDAGVPFVNARLEPRAELNETLPSQTRRTRAQMIAIVDGYFDTMQHNDGTLHTAIDSDCNRREDGMQTTNNPDAPYPIMKLGCAAQFQLGFYRFDDQLRARRFALVDTERGLLMAGVFIDHAGDLGSYALSDGRQLESMYHRPHTFYMIETFKIRDGRIQRIEAVFTAVPYRMPSPWSATQRGATGR